MQLNSPLGYSDYSISFDICMEKPYVVLYGYRAGQINRMKLYFHTTFCVGSVSKSEYRLRPAYDASVAECIWNVYLVFDGLVQE